MWSRPTIMSVEMENSQNAVVDVVEENKDAAQTVVSVDMNDNVQKEPDIVMSGGEKEQEASLPIVKTVEATDIDSPRDGEESPRIDMDVVGKDMDMTRTENFTDQTVTERRSTDPAFFSTLDLFPRKRASSSPIRESPRKRQHQDPSSSSGINVLCNH